MNRDGGFSTTVSPSRGNVRDIDRDVKPELRLGRRTCQCGECELFFGSETPLDRHRIFINPKVEDWDQRKCLSPSEMLAVGMTVNPYGVWQKGIGKKAALERVTA